MHMCICTYAKDQGWRYSSIKSVFSLFSFIILEMSNSSHTCWETSRRLLPWKCGPSQQGMWLAKGPRGTLDQKAARTGTEKIKKAQAIDDPQNFREKSPGFCLSPTQDS